jgi:hypothetical protein
MLEMELRRAQAGQAGRLQLLDEVRYAVEETEERVKYIKQWTQLQNWEVDFHELEERRQAALEDHHPCKLVEPYLRRVPT